MLASGERNTQRDNSGGKKRSIGDDYSPEIR
jgi:hypothetical protein